MFSLSKTAPRTVSEAVELPQPQPAPHAQESPQPQR